jgi:hypothetical protein
MAALPCFGHTSPYWPSGKVFINLPLVVYCLFSIFISIMAYFAYASGLFRPVPALVLAWFDPHWPDLKLVVAYFRIFQEQMSGLLVSQV